MACCKNKASCQKQESMQSPAEPVVADFTSSGIEFIAQIIEVAKGGLCDQLKQLLGDAVFKNEQVKNLAETVVALVAENEYLKKIGRILTPEVRVTDQNFELFFGPQNAYRLAIPFENEVMRANFSSQLRAAADKLENKTTETPPQQMKFTF